MSERSQVVLEVLALVSGRELESLRPEQDLVADLELDSAKALRLLVELEDRFDTEISDEDASGLSTVADLLAYAERSPT